MSSFTHIVLYLLFFLVAFSSLRKLQKMNMMSNTYFWYAVLGVVFLFILLEGCRYMRGPDWLAYKYRFEHIDVNESQKGFLFYMLLLRALGFNYIGYFVTNAALFIGCIFLFIRNVFDYRISSYFYLLAILAMLVRFECQIRQYIAMPFIFLSIQCFISKKWIPFVAFVAVSNTIHSGSLFLLAVFCLAYTFLKFTLPYRFLLIGLFFSYFLASSDLLTNYFSRILSGLNFDFVLASDHFSRYLENTDRWFGAGSYLETTEQSSFVKLMQFGFEASCIIGGFFSLKHLENSNNLIFKTNVLLSDVEVQVIRSFFNISCLGFILNRLFFGYEIFQRIFGQLYILWFVPVGFVFYLYYIREYINIKYLGILIFFMMVYLCLFWGKFVFFNSTAMFIWDKI